MRVEPADLLAALIHFEMGERQQWLGESQKAKAYLDQITSVDPIADPDYWSMLAICSALEGNKEAMESLLPDIRNKTESVNRKFRFQVECEMHIAIAYLVLGDRDQALSTLEAASKMDGPIFLNRELDLWFIFDRLRGNPRFEALLKD